jgi:uncharacterized protein (TIGR03083 family)
VVEPDYGALVGESAGAFADLIDSLDDAQLDTPSLCAGWRVRDVAGHLCSGLSLSIPTVLRETAKAGFRVDAASKVGAVAWADAHTSAEMAATIRHGAAIYRDGLPRTGMLRVLKSKDLVLDNLVHTQDVRRPLGLGTDVPEHRLRVALELAPTTKGFVKAAARAKGLRLEATDLDWSWGSGLLLRGAGEAIVLALTGRSAVLAELEGDGVTLLRQRS